MPLVFAQSCSLDENLTPIKKKAHMRSRALHKIRKREKKERLRAAREKRQNFEQRLGIPQLNGVRGAQSSASTTRRKVGRMQLQGGRTGSRAVTKARRQRATFKTKK